MRILDRSVYVGPSLYAHFPVIRLELDLGELEAWPTARLGGEFVDKLAAALPGLQEHGCSYREPGGFYRRMREDEGTWLGHVLEHVAIELQNIAGESVTFGKTRSAGKPGVYTVVYEYAQRDEGIAAGELGAATAVLAAARGDPAGGQRAGRLELARRRATNSSALRSAARSVRRPRRWCAPPKRVAFRGCASTTSRLVQLGHGKYQQRIQATVTGRTSHIAVELASDKEETNKILGDARPAGAAPGAGAERGTSGARRPPHRLSRSSPSRTTATMAAAFRSA